MSKASAMTSRETPVQPVSSVTAGGLVIHSESFEVASDARVQIIDLTDRITAHIRRVGIREGTASIWSMHTTCAVFVNEAQAALIADMTEFLERFAERERYYRHNDPELSDCARGNADAHLRAMLLGHSLTLQVSGGEAVLGQWQRILAAELDGPRTRTLRVQIMGVA